VDRRQFVRYGLTGVAGLTLGKTPGLSWLADLTPVDLFADGGVSASEPWRFGVMADSQWQRNLDGRNPGASAISLVGALNKRFIAHGVRFVVQVGDMADAETDRFNAHPAARGQRTMPIRALAAKTLYDAGIGFFPLRGNHESSRAAAQEFVGLYPQTRGQAEVLAEALNFSSPSESLGGLSYSFDVGNARFVLLDQFSRLDGTGGPLEHNRNIIDQQAWINERLSDRPTGHHAFVFGHKPLIGQYHRDTLLGKNPASYLAARDAFVGGLQANGVRYYVCGHDHMHDRSLVRSPNGAASVEQLICAAGSHKYKIPARPANDIMYNRAPRETNLSQETYTIGYYIFTVDGDNVTVDYYGASNGLDYGHTLISKAPTHPAFHRRERWGYGQKGKRFLVKQGGAYTGVKDAFEGTSAKILSGKNRNKSKDRSGRKLAKVVTTGWETRPEGSPALSNVFRLWGMVDNLAVWSPKLKGLLPSVGRGVRTDTFTLSLSLDPALSAGLALGTGRVGIAAKNASGEWFNAVDFNYGGGSHFVHGPWKPGYRLGTHGVDPVSRTAWAVINHQAEFVVTSQLHHGTTGAQRSRA
jgi:hypothetical protein